MYQLGNWKAGKTDGSLRPYMLFAKYALSVDADGNPRTVSGAAVKTRTVSHDGGISLCKTASTGYSLKTAADDWYVKAMFLLKYATKNSQNVFAGCTGHVEQVNPTVAESKSRASSSRNPPPTSSRSARR